MTIYNSWRAYKRGDASAFQSEIDARTLSQLRALRHSPHYTFLGSAHPAGTRTAFPPCVVTVDHGLSTSRYCLVAYGDGFFQIYDDYAISRHSYEVDRVLKFDGFTDSPATLPGPRYDHHVENLPGGLNDHGSLHSEIKDYVDLHEECICSRKFVSQLFIQPIHQENFFVPAPQSKEVSCCKWLPHESEGVIASLTAGTIVVWDLHSSKSLLSVTCHNSPVTYFALDTEIFKPASGVKGPSRGLVACCSQEPQACLRLLDLRNGAFCSVSHAGKHSAAGLICAAWSPIDSNLLVSATYQGNLCSHDIRKPGAPLQVFAPTSKICSHTALEAQQLENANGNISAKRIFLVPKVTPDMLDKKKPGFGQSDASSHLSVAQAALSKASVGKDKGITQISEELWDYVRSGGKDSDSLQNSRLSKLSELRSQRVKTCTGFSAPRHPISQKSDIREVIPAYATIRQIHKEISDKDRAPGEIASSTEYPPTSLQFNSDGTHVISSSLGYQNINLALPDHVRIWDLIGGDCGSPLVSHSTYRRNCSCGCDTTFEEKTRNSRSYKAFSISAEVMRIGSTDYYITGVGSGISVINSSTGAQVAAFPESPHKLKILSVYSLQASMNPIQHHFVTIDIGGSLSLWTSASA